MDYTYFGVDCHGFVGGVFLFEGGVEGYSTSLSNVEKKRYLFYKVVTVMTVICLFTALFQ